MNSKTVYPVLASLAFTIGMLTLSTASAEPISADQDAAILARLSFWLPPERVAMFEQAYEARLLPILESHGLRPSSEEGRATVDSVFSRLFEVKTPSDVRGIRRVLDRDSTWTGALQDLGATIGSPGERGRIRYRFGIYAAPSGPGKPLEVEARMTETQGAGFWRTYSWVDGTVSLAVRSITQDREGHIWVGAIGGVSRYDGKNWTTFTTRDGLASNYVLDICQDREGNMWFGTGIMDRKAGEGRGVSRCDGEDWTTYTTQDGLASDYVSAVRQDRQGNMWFGTDAGVTRYDPSAEPEQAAWRTFTTRDGLVSGWIRTICEDRQGNLWFGTLGGGVSRYDPSAGSGQAAWTTFTRKDGLADNSVRKIFQDRDGILWFGTRGGVNRHDPTAERGQPAWTTLTTEDGLVDNSVSSIVQDPEGHLWFSTFQGISRYDGKTFTNFTSDDGLIFDVVHSSCLDREGHLWFGTMAGISRYDGSVFTTFSIAEGLSSNKALSTFQDRDGNLWFTTWPGVSLYDGRTLTNFVAPESEVLDYALNGVQDREGNIWMPAFFGTAGACRYDGRNWYEYTERDGYPIRAVLTIFLDRDGHLWFCTRRDGVIRYDGQSWTAYTTEDGLAGNWVWQALQDRTGAMWFITPWGATRYDGQSWRTFTEADGLAQNQLVFALEDRDGKLWFGTDAAGVTRYDPRIESGAGSSAGPGQAAWTTFTTEDGLPGNSVFAIHQDRRGHLWFGGFDGGGVSRYDGQVFQTLTAEDGPAGNSIYMNGLFEDRSGAIWISTSQGVTRFQQPPLSPPGIVIDAVVADRRYEDISELAVPSTVGLAAFEFYGTSLKTRPDGMAYRYRLNGHEAEWRNTRDTRVEYLDLPRGDYTFEVVAVDRDLVYSEAPAVVRLTVHLPYDRIGLVAGLGIALILVAWQTVRVLRRDRRLQESVAALSDANKELFGANQQLQREGAVARVRAQVQAMEQTSDFDRVLSLVADDLKTAGLTFDTCGIDVLDEPVDEPTMEYFEEHGFRYTTYTIDPEGNVDRESYATPAPFPPVVLETVERFTADQPWRARTEENAIVEVPVSGYGRLRLTASDRQTFTDDDIDTLRDFAAAIALGYARYLDIREIQLQTERKSSFLASMSHELRTPMNAIIGFTNMVLRREGEKLSERQQGNLSKVIDAGKRLLGLINDLMDLSKIEAGRMDVEAKRFSVDALVRSCCAEVEPLVKPGVKLAFDISDDVGDVETDEGRVRQILTNLLSNAVKFTEQGQVTVRALRDAEDMVITVADTGAGIPQDQMDTIFEEFQQVKGSDAERQGTGLGLPICKGFAELLGGSIRATSEVGAGSAFTLRIPMVYRQEDAG